MACRSIFLEPNPFLWNSTKQWISGRKNHKDIAAVYYFKLIKPLSVKLIDYVFFQVHDVIYLTEKINADWLKGRLNKKEGMFPSNFVNVVVPLETSEEEKSKCVVALYNFVPQTWDDLSFQVSELIIF